MTKVLEAEIIEDNEDEIDPTDLSALFFRKVKLSEDQKKAVIADIDKQIRDGQSSRGELDNLLAHWNDMAEGIAVPKNFPWQDSSNLFVPVTEMKLNDVHASGRQTLLKGDQMYYVRSIGIKGNYEDAAKLERYLNYKSMVELPIIDRFSQILWCAERDGTVMAQVQWSEKKDKVKKIVPYKDLNTFIDKYPTPDDAGLSNSQYIKVVEKLKSGKPVRLLETVEETIYKGPSIHVVQLIDFVMNPITAIKTENANLVGKIFTRRASELKYEEKYNGWDDVDKVIDSKEDGKNDLDTNLKDQIEGISRRSGRGEFVLFDGIHRYDLDEDGVEEKYLAVYHPRTKTLLDYIYYPYIHNKDCFIPVRLKKRPGRFLGRGLCQMLDDTQSEINTQHNQRVDTRTITTVPTFKAKSTTKKTFDPSRPDTRFCPGRVFYLDNMDDVVQFDIRGTDLGESMNEESSLMQIADQLTGSSQLKSGRETKSDPRAPAAKVMTLLQQSNIRLDDYFEEIAGSAPDNEGLNAIGEMCLELFYQFFDEDLAEIPALKPNMQPEMTPEGKPIKIGLTQEQFYIRNRYKIQMAKTSASMNPDAMLLKFMQLYSLLIQDPLVGGRPEGRLALDRRLLALSREENPEMFLPKTPEEAAQVMQIAELKAALEGGGGKPQGGAGHARNRGGEKKAAVPAAGGSTRPLG